MYVGCFVLGFLITFSVITLDPFTALANHTSKREASECVNQYFDDSVYYGKIIGEDGKALWQFESGTYIITTNHQGDRILSVVLSPKASAEVIICKDDYKTQDELKALALSELDKYIDVRYDWTYVIEQNEGSDLIHIEMLELRDGYETGASGYFVYYADGTLFSYSYIDRVIEDPKNETIITEEEAVSIAKKEIESRYSNVEQIVLGDDDGDPVLLRTVQIGQIYQIQMSAKTDSRIIHMTVIVMAKDGSIYDVYDTEH